MLNQKVKTTEEYNKIYNNSFEGVIVSFDERTRVAVVKISKGKNPTAGLTALDKKDQISINIHWLEVVS